MNKKKQYKNGLAYSTDPSLINDNIDDDIATLPPKEQLLKVMLDTKQRAGKVVTLIVGFVGQSSDADTLGKKLKNYCGTGGSVKDNIIIIQGDQRLKIKQWLSQNGYQLTK